jgi:hypothetical protein
MQLWHKASAAVAGHCAAVGCVLLRLSLLLCVRWCMHHTAHWEDTSNAASEMCAILDQHNKQCLEASLALCARLQDEEASESMSDAIPLMSLFCVCTTRHISSRMHTALLWCNCKSLFCVLAGPGDSARLQLFRVSPAHCTSAAACIT